MSRRARRRLVRFVRKWFGWITILKNLILAVIGGLFCFVELSLDASSRAAKAQTWLRDQMGDGGILALLAIPIVVVIVTDVLQYLSPKLVDKYPEGSSFSMLVAFARVVTAKTERFAKYRHTQGEDAFLGITQPWLQIRALVQELYLTLQKVTRDEDLKVVLAKCEDGKLSTLYNAPPDAIPSISDTDLNCDTFLSYVAGLNKRFAIRDLGKEKRYQEKFPTKPKRFLFLGEDGEEDGGIAGFPLRRFKKDSIIYVLSLRSEEVVDFTNDTLRTLESIVKEFERRIQLEYELERIRHERENGA